MRSHKTRKENLPKGQQSYVVKKIDIFNRSGIEALVNAVECVEVRSESYENESEASLSTR